MTSNLTIGHCGYLCGRFHLGSSAFFSDTRNSSLETLSLLLLVGRRSSLKSEMIHKTSVLLQELTEQESPDIITVFPNKTRYSIMAVSTMKACTANHASFQEISFQLDQVTLNNSQKCHVKNKALAVSGQICAFCFCISFRKIIAICRDSCGFSTLLNIAL